ncbi:non-hydrolyzing UDP-N-acetylglucosamine 2-epimerase [Candidatus Soleaferrea massiliensis]|uniref:non-hydrolyzing UDP-N-acetylglucosamine 2-epimerase n=1 Tax=Candidatus Soleaferrea massiliensis TaxID=1470354 RepID=UPI00058C9EAF|nr:UDP-N-acetylglucosamine 2-epimerase (non-hydrolyzing) [Candidatus Soleaferrea massiliensis]
MERMKLVTILGTRPEIIRLSRIIALCERCFEHRLVHTGQNYDYRLSGVFFEELGIRPPDYYLDCAGENPGRTVGNVIARCYDVLKEERPDAVLVLGDTHSAMSVYAAGQLHIPIFHMEAGNRCWDRYLSESRNRELVDRMADVNLCYTEHARQNLQDEGRERDMLFVVGSPMREVLRYYAPLISQSDVLCRLGLQKKEYIVVSAHREENVDREETFAQIVASVNAAAYTYDRPVLFSVHPRTRKWIETRHTRFDKRVRLLEPFGFPDYVRLQKDSFFVLSDSGTLSEESAIERFPAVLMRTSTERPEIFDCGGMLLGGIHPDEVLRAVQLLLETGPQDACEVEAYMPLDVSRRVVRLIGSYTGVIQRKVWRKP